MNEPLPRIADPALRFLLREVARHLIAVGKLMQKVCGGE
jgi:hypothetical protein